MADDLGQSILSYLDGAASAPSPDDNVLIPITQWGVWETPNASRCPIVNRTDPIEGAVGSESAYLEAGSGNIVGEVAEAMGGTAEVFRAGQ